MAEVSENPLVYVPQATLTLVSAMEPVNLDTQLALLPAGKIVLLDSPTTVPGALNLQPTEEESGRSPRAVAKTATLKVVNHVLVSGMENAKLATLLQDVTSAHPVLHVHQE